MNFYIHTLWWLQSRILIRYIIVIFFYFYSYLQIVSCLSFSLTFSIKHVEYLIFLQTNYTIFISIQASSCLSLSLTFSIRHVEYLIFFLSHELYYVCEHKVVQIRNTWVSDKLIWFCGGVLLGLVQQWAYVLLR